MFSQFFAFLFDTVNGLLNQTNLSVLWIWIFSHPVVSPLWQSVKVESGSRTASL